MQAWLHWFQGPVFWAAVAFLVLGLARRLGVTFWEMGRALRRAGDKTVVYRKVWRDALYWLSPRAPFRMRPLVGVTSVAFHLSIIVVPLFLAGHIALLKAAIGWSWPALPNGLATVLTVAVVVAAPALVVQRLASRAARDLSRFQDYALPLLVAAPFVTGLLAMHPAWNPFPFDLVRLVHAMSADLVLVLIPVTKLSHIALFPVSQLVTELAWHFSPDGGRKVGEALGRASEPI